MSHLVSSCAIRVPTEPAEWVQLMPLGRVVGRDGREWQLSDPEAVIAATRELGMDLPIDFDHQLETGPEGVPAPAAGWIKELAVRDDGLYGRVEWTVKGAAALRDGAFRYLSPVFRYHTGTKQVMQIRGAGLIASRIYRTGEKNSPNEFGTGRDFRHFSHLTPPTHRCRSPDSVARERRSRSLSVTGAHHAGVQRH